MTQTRTKQLPKMKTKLICQPASSSFSSSSSSSSLYEPTRAARPDEVNYVLIQKMGEGFHRKRVKISALGTTFDMVYGEWVGVGKSHESSPVVLCLHGAPATEGAFRPIGSLVAAEGYRVVAINFPGMGITEIDPERKYNFSASHKTELVTGFLSALQLKRVAMVIGHSGGSHVVSRMAADPELETVMQSACFLCGSGLTPYRAQRRCTAVPYMAPVIYKTMYAPWIGRFITDKLAAVIHRYGFRGKTPESQVLGIYEGYQMRFDQYATDLARLGERRLPMLILYCLDDAVIQPDTMPPCVEVLQIPVEGIKECDENDISDRTFSDDVMRRVVQFAKGTHRLQFTKPHQTTQEIVSLLDALHKNDSSGDAKQENPREQPTVSPSPGSTSSTKSKL